MGVKHRRKPRPRFLPRQRKALRRPLFVGLAEQRQIEQPFAGVIDDIQGEAAICAILPLVVDHQPQFADIRRGVRPAPFIDQVAQMSFVIETRHRVVGLRLQPCARDPSGGERFEYRKAAAARQAMNQRGDEDGLTGA
jgi:hypothetical protein